MKDSVLRKNCIGERNLQWRVDDAFAGLYGKTGL